MDNEEENKFFAVVDLKAFNINNKITVEKADKSNELNQHRFVNQTQELQRSPVKLSVKEFLRYPVKCFEWKTVAVARFCSFSKLRQSFKALC